GVDVPAFGDQHEGCAGELFHHVGIDDVDGRLVDQPHGHTAFLQADHCIERAIHDLAHGNDVAAPGRGCAHDVILARLERLPLVQGFAVVTENVRHGRACGEQESQPGIVEYP